MKNISMNLTLRVLACVLGFSSHAFAGNGGVGSAGISQVPSEQLQAYKDVVIKALRTQGIDSSRCMNGNAPQNIYIGQAGYIDPNLNVALVNQMTQLDITDGAQPLLKFSEISKDDSRTVEVTTSSDFSKIISLHIVESQASTVQVEKGNMKNPDAEMVTTWSVTGIVDCK